MCVTVLIDGKQVATTRAELESALGGAAVQDHRYTRWESHDCLCGCNIEATVEKFGARLSSGAEHDYLISRN